MELVDTRFNAIYRTIGETLLYTPDHCITSKDGEELSELVDFRFCLQDQQSCFATCRGMSIPYLKGEVDFYMSGSPFVKDIAKHSKFWEKISDDGRCINSNYGKLLFHDRNLHGYTQFEYAMEMLLRNKDSKKAVMVIYHRDHTYKSKDNPCTMFLQFLIRNNKLSLYVKMRSSDMWFGLPYDVPFFCYVQFLMWRKLTKTYTDLLLGQYWHQATSLHLYKRNTEQLRLELSKERPKENSQADLFREIFVPYLSWGD